MHDGYTRYASGKGGTKNLDTAAEIKRSNMLPRDRLGKVTKGFLCPSRGSPLSSSVFRSNGRVCFACCLEMFVPCVSDNSR